MLGRKPIYWLYFFFWRLPLVCIVYKVGAGLIPLDDDYGGGATGGQAVGSLCNPYVYSQKLASEHNSSFSSFTSFTTISLSDLEASSV